MRIDKHEQVDIVSVENYANVAGIRFDLPVSLTAKTKDDAEMAHALKVLTPGQYRAPATILDIQHAQTVLVSLPREDGSVMYLEVHPQEPNFKKFAQACLVSLAGQMNSLMKESVLPAGGGGGINNPDFAEPTLPLQHPANFEGDLAEFDKILPQLIERAALKWKMPLHSLDAEATLISRNAAQCSSLTPQVVAALSPEDRSQLEQGRSYPKWQACEGGFVPVSRLIRQYDPKTERGVLYTIKPVGGWENARAVEMKIQLTGLPGDGVLGNLFDYYGVVDAKIRVASNGQPNPSAAIPARPYVVASGPSTGGSPPSSSRAAIPEAIPGGYSGPTAPSSTATGGKSPVDSHTGRVTRALPSINGHAQLTAPGRGNHSYNVFYIDTRDFAQGGELDLMIQVDKNSRTSGSFELFAGETRFSATGGSTRPLAGKYDVPPGERIHLKYRFSAGQVFALGAEGNWFSPKGVTGDVIFQASVH